MDWISYCRGDGEGHIAARFFSQMPWLDMFGGIIIVQTSIDCWGR